VIFGDGQIARQDPRQISRANHALDAANFFLADVRDALGPYLAIYLLTERKWDAASIGVVMSIATIAGILAQTPAGAVVDAIKAKRAVMITAAVAVTAASLILPWLSSFWPVAVSQATAHAAGVVFGPALAAVTLGIVGHRAFTRESAATRPSITPATRLPQRPRAFSLICGGRRWCSICSRRCRLRAS
jgi:MFS family permease